MNRRLIIIAILLATGAGVYFYMHKSADNVEIQSGSYNCVTSDGDMSTQRSVRSCKECPTYYIGQKSQSCTKASE
jgi:hypothetical protein